MSSGERDERASGRKLVTITVSTNERRWLADCLGSLTAGDRDDVEVLLVDNASADGTADFVAERFPGVRVLRSGRNLGFAGANNLGLRYALDRRAEYVFLVNPDTRTPPGLIQRLVDFLDAWPQYGIVGPMQYTYPEDGSPRRSYNEWTRGALEVGESHIFVHTWPDHPSPAGPAHGRAPNTLEHAYVQGCALACRTEVLRRVGLFDPAYHTYYEESDLCRRARWAGWRVALLTDVGIQHYGGGGTRASVYRRRKMLRNKYYFLFTDPEWRWRRIARLTARWIRYDLTRRGAAPAETAAAAAADTLIGLAWLVSQVPRMWRRRRGNRTLLRDGAGGPPRGAATDAPPRPAVRGEGEQVATS